VERGSDKHGFRLDDQMAGEVDGMMRAGRSTHAEEWKDPEAAGEDQPEVDRAPHETLEGGVPAGMTAGDVERRSEIAAVLGKEIYPATGAQLLERAETNEATDRVLADLRRLDAGATYVNIQDVWSSLGGGVEEQRF
jgi:uncharacterized protein DUF2795